MIDQQQILRIPFGEGIAGLVAQTGRCSPGGVGRDAGCGYWDGAR